jgi:hypothetical protein
MNLTIDIKRMVHFYDADRLARAHSSAVKLVAHEEFAVQLLIHFFNENKQPARALDIPCTAREGRAWLDKWLVVEQDDRTIHYQVEVKGWSFHGYGGGRSLEVGCSDGELGARMQEEFANCWNNQSGRFRALGLDKVLREMNTKHSGEIRPLACLWTAMHPDGRLDEPLFEVPGVKRSHFASVWVFSVSAYLRQLLREKQSRIELDLPKTSARLEHLDAIYKRPQTRRSTAASSL